MLSPTDSELIDQITKHESTAAAMEEDNISVIVDDDDEDMDPFLQFIDYSISILSPGEEDEESDIPGWNWVASRILRTCKAYSSGVTPGILLSELSQAWGENQRGGASKKKRPECINRLERKHKRGKLPNTVTIDSIYEKNFLSLSGVLEAVIVDAFLLEGTNFYMLTLGDFWSSNTIDLYLHRRFYDLASPRNGILHKGREILLTGCYLRPASIGSGQPRLLPTEYLLILLDQDDDGDAMLLGAQFCTDSLSSISMDEANAGACYSLYARIESVGSLEIQGKYGTLQRKEITLVDNDGFRIKFLLWGDQIILANLLSVGSWLALDKPFVSSAVDSGFNSPEQVCLEYGSATQLFLVPFVQHEEQVCVAMTQNHYHGSKLLSAFEATQGPRVSQVSLPCDSQGAIDFSNYPFRLSVSDLRDKMTSISFYGTVTDITGNNTNSSEAVFSLKIEDNTGAIWAKLHFVKSWSLGRVGIGHTVYISGLTCSMTKRKSIEVSWYEKDNGVLFYNLSCLPALLNSSCLHKLSRLSALSTESSGTRVCRIRIERIEHCHVTTRFSHAICGHSVSETISGYECYFCRCSCAAAEVVRCFDLKVTIADETAKVFAWCTGQTATELLQISPDEYYQLSEEEQTMYPSSLESDKFIVAMVNCRREHYGLVEPLIREDNKLMWEITRALKND